MSAEWTEEEREHVAALSKKIVDMMMDENTGFAISAAMMFVVTTLHVMNDKEDALSIAEWVSDRAHTARRALAKRAS